jgi:hypothetical protein
MFHKTTGLLSMKKSDDRRELFNSISFCFDGYSGLDCLSASLFFVGKFTIEGINLCKTLEEIENVKKLTFKSIEDFIADDVKSRSDFIIKSGNGGDVL